MGNLKLSLALRTVTRDHDDWPPSPRPVYKNPVVHIVNYVYKIILVSNLRLCSRFRAACGDGRQSSRDDQVLVSEAVAVLQQALLVQVMVQRLLLLVFCIL